MMIQFKGVHKYLFGQHILKGIDLEIKSGETFVILGPTGTGKSVTLRHIVGLHVPDSGEVFVDGMDVGRLRGRRLEKLRSRFGVLFQSGALLNWMNIKDNVALPLREAKRLKEDLVEEKVENVLSTLGLREHWFKMPGEISGGMKKRAGLARAIVTDPELILYDEPTSGLDPIMSRKIDELIVSLKNRLHITSVVVTHDLISAFNIADRIALLNDGRVEECCSVEEFKKSENKYVREFIAAQTAGS
ncbi:MAG: hypothetical protein A2020_12460 [Lentisphaerae bacterium GWF2_45_14]|nr:MAG: hypothetical protein A2020_12460 [Lentisphaerae bacterium GWF2_45_14]